MELYALITRAIYLFTHNSTIVFSNDSAVDYGGAIVAYLQCGITFGDNSIVTFLNSNSTIISKDDTNLFFNDLSARWHHNKCLPYTGQGRLIVLV